jgi:hypothetical protein
MNEQEYLKECFRFLDYFKVDYSGDVIYGDSAGNSCIYNPKSQFAELFMGKSINSVARYVAERTGKRFEYVSDEY